MCIRSHKRLSTGFTLFELVVVMLIVAVLAAIGLPSFKYVTASNRISKEINAFLADMRYARSEALKEGLPVTVCASADGLTCTGGSSSVWTAGWIVFSDPSSSQTVPSGAVPLRVQPSLTQAFNSSDTLTADNGFYAETFNREGFGAANIARPGNTVTMVLHSVPANSDWTRCLAITTVGLLTVQRTTSGNGACT